MTAKLVGMSVRTLQRRLAHAGATHHTLVAQVRFATAAAVLEQTDAKILNLALDLGYSDHANFTRAFRRWAGCAPREYRSRTGTRNAPDVGRREDGFGRPAAPYETQSRLVPNVCATRPSAAKHSCEAETECHDKWAMIEPVSIPMRE